MNVKKTAKCIIDIFMTAALLCLMAFQLTGDELHEWIGVTELVLFVIHNLLNIRFYTTLFKGRYMKPRIVRMVINVFALVAVLCTAFSGMIMSRYVFAPLPIAGSLAAARSIHLAASYWTFVLMSMHIGLHWSMVISRIKAIRTEKRTWSAVKWCARILAAAIAGCGLYSFIKADIISYMFLKNKFVFFDFEKAAYIVFAENIAMMSLFVFVTYYAANRSSSIKNIQYTSSN